jgi:signal transduction histidine kinase
MSFHSESGRSVQPDEGMFESWTFNTPLHPGRGERRGAHLQIADELASERLKQDLFQRKAERPGGEIAIVDADWIIIAANDAWRRATAREALNGIIGIGSNFLDHCLAEAGLGIVEAEAICRGMQLIDSNATKQFRYSYRAGANGEQVDLVITRFDGMNGCYAVISRSNVGELSELRLVRRRLTRRLLRAQEEERRRVARDLHDTSAQHLVGISLSLARLQAYELPPEASELIADMGEMLHHFYRDLRGMSFLMHPPELEAGQLRNAVKLLCEGFVARSELGIDWRITGWGDPAPSTEAAIYRVLQEALGNVQKHAKAQSVKVRLALRRDAVVLIVRDDGVGIDLPLSGTGDPSRIGVGISGMIARVTELGGRLSVHSARQGTGTVVAAAIPARPPKIDFQA